MTSLEKRFLHEVCSGDIELYNQAKFPFRENHKLWLWLIKFRLNIEDKR